MPIWMKSLSQEEYWYYFKALAFGSMDPDEHPKLASLGMQLATELKGSFLGANILGEMLRSNPNARFWHAILSSVRALVQEHMFSVGVHPEDLLERNVPVGFTNVSFVGAQSQGCLVHYWKRMLCRGPEALPRAKSRALGKDTLCRGPATGALGKERPSAKRPLPRVRPSAKTGPRQIKSLPRAAALGKDALGKLGPLGHGGHSRQALPRATR